MRKCLLCMLWCASHALRTFAHWIGVPDRVCLFGTGCRLHCKGCFYECTGGFGYGKEFTADSGREVLGTLGKGYIAGLSILGEPFEPKNQAVLARFTAFEDYQGFFLSEKDSKNRRCLKAISYRRLIMDLTLGDLIEDEEAEDPASQTERTDLKEQIRNILETLPQREREVLKMRFRLEDGYALTLEDVGLSFDVTRERIRMIEAKALRRLRHSRRGNALCDLLDT